MVFSYTGSFTQTQLVLAQQGRKAMFSLRSKLKRFVNINSVVYCDLFDKMVMPVLSYGCEIWGFYPAKAIEQVHKDFCKSILKVKRSTMNEIMIGELERIPLTNVGSMLGQRRRRWANIEPTLDDSPEIY